MARWPVADVCATPSALAAGRAAAAATAAMRPRTSRGEAEAAEAARVARRLVSDVCAALLACAQRGLKGVPASRRVAASAQLVALRPIGDVFGACLAFAPSSILRPPAPVSAASTAASDRDPALSVPHPFCHRGSRHLNIRAKACTRALHSFRVVKPIALSADGRNEATFPPDPHVTAHFGLVGAPVERAPPAQSPGRFLRVAEP